MDLDEQAEVSSGARNTDERNRVVAPASHENVVMDTNEVEQAALGGASETHQNDGSGNEDAAEQIAPSAPAVVVEDDSFESLHSEGESEEMQDAASLPEIESDAADEQEDAEPEDEQYDEHFDPLLVIHPLIEQQLQELQNDENEDNAIMEEDRDDAEEEDDDNASLSSSSEVIHDVDDDQPNNRQRWYVHADHVHAAIRELIAQGRRGEGGVVGPLLQRDNFMQRMRRAIFSMEHTRRRNRRSGSGSAGNSSMDADFDDAEATDEAEERPPEEAPENPISFDTNLPAEHSYLGDNMDRVSGVNYLDAGHQYRMMLFAHQHVFFPGEVLPFMISGSIIESDIDTQNGLLFGVCFPSLCNDERDEYLYGVTCQIYEKGTDERGNTLIKSRALQRFVTKSTELHGPLEYIASHPQLKHYGYVRILPEIYLPEPLKCINMGSMNRFRDNASMRDTYKRYQAATTPWPAHVYEYYSITAIVDKARTLLAEHKIDTMPTDPIQLSFWLVRNLHLSESLMKSIFVTDSVNSRMKIISSTFKEIGLFTCRYCGNRIANCNQLFAMSKHGVQTQYCNSAGYIHETNTVYHLQRDAVSYSGEPSAEFSWFPGYKWHIIVCKICLRHIGWEFKALEPNLVPKSFFGISSSSVYVSSPTALPNPRSSIRSIMRMARRQVP